MRRPTDYLLRMFYRAASGRRPSRTMGRLSDVALPRTVLDRMIRSYCAAFKIDPSEAEVPPGGYRTFNAFFTRRLKPGARTIDVDPAGVPSPCDGRVQSSGTVRRGMVLQAKGREYALAELLGDADVCARFEGGPFVTIYLSPRDYHRVHFPIDGEVLGCRHIEGSLYTVAPRAAEVVDRLFARNERLTTLTRGPLGPCAIVMVGATGVGRISAAYCDATTNVGRASGQIAFDPGIPCTRGAELGTFNLGSTVILILGPGTWESSVPPVGGPVRTGQRLFRKG